MKFTVMVSSQGTACAETALCKKHDTKAWRREAETSSQQYGRDKGVEWKRGIQNEVLACIVCGRK